MDPDDGHLFKSLGCATENLVHAASAQGFGADVEFDSDKGEIVIRLQRSASARASNLYEAITRRQCVKKEYDGRSLDASVLRRLEAIGHGDSVRTIILTSSAQKESVIEYVTRGNQVQLTDPAFRRELVSWIRFNARHALRRGDGLAARTAGQPPLPAWLGKLIIGRVLMAKSQVNTDARYIRSSAGIAVFSTSTNRRSAWVEVGRVYERFALQATALDVRTAFVNQPVEVRALRSQFESWLGLAGQHALLIVRFGYGIDAPFSLRRPLDQVIDAAG